MNSTEPEKESSPYASPQSIEHDYINDVAEIVPAGKWLRLANFILDYFGFFLLAVVIGILAGLLGGDELLSKIDQMGPLEERFFGLALMLIYYLFFEGFFGFTPGKLVTGTRVVDLNGRKPKVATILGRTLCRFIPFEPLSFFGSTRRGWHDSISNTYVIKVHRK
ncbi:RDD family protein [Aliikangiella sp. G2MR2-5]|uniref:RDD family protein n=1 Tax=Aliikangiella sp. G2MR2-5 TaxID=2788943 RepID=UPI0018AA0857|nr:RDD family protein [Aliikangiella sp. G2MR2-5]